MEKPKIKRILFIIIPILFLFLLSCIGKMRLTILFDKDPEIEKGAPVILDEKVIGEVKGVKLKGGKTAVMVSILPDYRRRIREESRFYLRSWTGKPSITVLIIDKSSPRMKSGLTLIGYPEYRYWIDKGIKSLGEFFESEEWKSFKEETKEKIEKGAEEGREFFEENLPKLREELQEIYNELEEEYGEEAREKAKEYVDSLIEEKK